MRKKGLDRINKGLCSEGVAVMEQAFVSNTKISKLYITLQHNKKLFTHFWR